MSTTPPPPLHMQKLKNFEDPKKTGKDVVQSKMKKNASLTSENEKKIVKNVDNTPLPPTLFMLKNRIIFFSKKNRNGGEYPQM